MKTNIALVGFMGVGKSTAGKILARRLGKRYIEADSLISKRAGKSIAQVFKDEGEIAFREIEIEVIKELASKEGLVIDCGGGVVLNRINVDRLKQNAKIIWLKASPSTILKRTSTVGDRRPLLDQQKNMSSIQSLIRFRKPFYDRAADIEVDTSKLSTESVVSKIIGRLKEYADFN